MNGENFDYGDHDDRELSDDERWARVEALTLDETLDRQQHALEQLAHGDPAGATNQWTSLHRTRKHSSSSAAHVTVSRSGPGDRTLVIEQPAGDRTVGLGGQSFGCAGR
jgi:hypothetical protein